jgi:hypothetical protein
VNTKKKPTLAEARAVLISLIAARGRKDRYAALLSRARTRAAQDLIQGLGFLGVELGARRSDRTTAFWATDKLLQRAAEDFGIHVGNINEHFKPEPPHNPLVLRGPTSWKGNRKIEGEIIRDYPRT